MKKDKYVYNPNVWIRYQTKKIDGTIKKIVRQFRRFFKKAFESEHKRRFYGWVSKTLREKARAFLFSYNLSAIDDSFYSEHEEEFIFFLYNAFAKSENKSSKKCVSKQY